jgi:hypothetical protein
MKKTKKTSSWLGIRRLCSEFVWLSQQCRIGIFRSASSTILTNWNLAARTCKFYIIPCTEPVHELCFQCMWSFFPSFKVSDTCISAIFSLKHLWKFLEILEIISHYLKYIAVNSYINLVFLFVQKPLTFYSNLLKFSS